MTDLPVLNLTCLKNPSGRCVLVAESCVNCRNRNVILTHAAAAQKDLSNLRESENCEFCITQRELGFGYVFCDNHIHVAREFQVARDAVLDLLPEELKEKDGRE